MNTTKEIREYIDCAISVAGSPSNLAAIAGVSTRTVYAWRTGDRRPRINSVDKIRSWLDTIPLSEHEDILYESVSKLKKNALKLPDISFSGDSYLEELDDAQLQDSIANYFSLDSRKSYNEQNVQKMYASSQVPLIPLLTNSSEENNIEQEGLYLDYKILQNFNVEHRFLRAHKVVGRGMEPTLFDNRFCLVDISNKFLYDDNVYILRYKSDFFVKRVCKLPGSFLFRNDNQDMSYQNFSLEDNFDSSSWAVVGKVIWGERLV